MLGKIVQLRGIPLENGFEVIYGADFNIDREIQLDFAKVIITSAPVLQAANYTYICGGFFAKPKKDGFKDIIIGRIPEEDIKEDDVEKYLFVIIPYSSKINSTARKLAGRYLTEAILEMHAGDTVEVSKPGGVPETYMVVQAGNELFLIKKKR